MIMKKNLWVKIFAVALVLMCVLTLAACSTEPDSPKDLEELDSDLEKEADKGNVSEGLKFKKVSKDGVEGYTVSGLGDCTDTVVIIPAEHEGLKVTGISSNAFKKSNITRIYLPEGITEIAHHAFAECASLENVKLPDSLVTMGSNVFSDCVALKNVYFGKNLTTVSKNAFNGCTHLTSITIPDSVTYIGSDAFKYSSSYGYSFAIFLEGGTPPTLDGNPFNLETYIDLTIYVETAYVDTYKTAWPQYADNIFAKP
jgi:hypothetical protein